MSTQELADQLERISSLEDLSARSEELTNAWADAGIGVEAVEPILRFIERHPSHNLGTPGALVHFVERFHGDGYEDKLVESIKRRPTFYTTWMLNRLINGTKGPDLRQKFVLTLKEARGNPLVDVITLRQIDRFLERLSK